MKIGIPRELKEGERRVALTPEGAKKLLKAGHQVLIQSGAGELSGFENELYQEAGATLVEQLEQVWGDCELLVKVKEPHPEEYKFLREDLSVFSFLHPAANKDLTVAMRDSGVTGLDYDLVTLETGGLPILEPMSVIAGKLSVQNGARFLEASEGGYGILLGGTPTVPPAKVLVVGCGNAGRNAAQIAVGMGAETTVLDINEEILGKFKKELPKVKTSLSTSDTLKAALKDTDLLIGAVLVPGAKAPKIITKEHLRLMKPKSVLVDICIDQGGFAETSRPTTISNPVYTEEGVVHCCVANMPAMVPRTSTLALTAETLPWIEKIASLGVEKAIQTLEPIRKSVTMKGRKITNKAVADAFGMKFSAV